MFTKRVRARMLGVLLTCATSVALDAVCKVHVAAACVCGVARQGSPGWQREKWKVRVSARAHTLLVTPRRGIVCIHQSVQGECMKADERE
jgi:hypothetical protein